MNYTVSIYNNCITKREGDEKITYLYYNSSTGAIAWLNEEIHLAFEMNDIRSIENMEYFDGLIKNGFVVPNVIDEYSRYMFKVNNFVLDKESDVASYIIALTMQCNLKCVYCFEEGNCDNDIANDGTINQIYLFITNSIKKQQKKKLSINWFGGEPLMAYQQIIALSKKLIAFCEENGIEYVASLVTNGTLLTEKKLDELIKHKVKHFQISLDGEKKEYNLLKRGNELSFDKAYESVLMVSNSIAGISVRLNVCNENKESLLRLTHRLVENLDFHGIIYAGKIMKYNDDSSYTEISDEEFYEFEKQVNAVMSIYPEYISLIRKSLKPKGASCGYMVSDRCLIDSRGYLYRCEHHINNPKYIIGDVMNGFYRNKIDYKFLFSELPNKCQKCSVMPICMGGCASDRILYDKWISCDYMHKKVVDNCLALL